jgi:1-acyl-sn-glycerol-3-phosphate acyltransferase
MSRGPDPTTVRRVHRVVAPVVKRYFRSEVRGLERLPDSQTILVAHHDGGVLPLNGLCFAIGWHEYHDFSRPLYVLTHDVLHDLSHRFAGFFHALGMVRADRVVMDNALASGASVLVFPGAARESFRPFARRHTIDLGYRTGFVRQAIRWQLPITPVVSAGSHETFFVLYGGQRLARRLGLPRLVRSGDVLPVLAGLPWGLWALPFVPQFPLPAKITTEVLPPIWLPDVLGRQLSPADAQDPELVGLAFRTVLARMRAALRRLYRERRLPVLG